MAVPSILRTYRACDGSHWLGKLVLYVPDRSGILATLAGLFGKRGINIVLFHYNRSEHANRVILEATSPDPEGFEGVLDEMRFEGLHDESLAQPSLALDLTDMRSILRMDVRLEHRPGTLGKFAAVLRGHEANVIQMEYNEAVSPESAQFSIATRDPGKVDVLLKDMNERGYVYGLIYKGADQKEIEDVIGLNLAERFFFKAKKLLPTEDFESLVRLVNSSKRLSDTLVKFAREAGKDLEAGTVFTNVLAFASASLAKSGSGFTYAKLRGVERMGLELHGFRLPTGGNIYVIESGGELVMVDGSYGLYYASVKAMLRENGIDPARIKRVYLTHADADHAGMSGHFVREYGSKVFLHRVAKGAITNENRAWGSSTPFVSLNGLFTVLVNRFTCASYPEECSEFELTEQGRMGGFPVIDEFAVGDRRFLVLESLGGHVPGQTFFVSPEAGILFTADHLLNLESLSPEERKVLDYPKFMMVSTNVDSVLFRREMEMLSSLANDIEAEICGRGYHVLIAPGHGDFYGSERFRL
jgi:glyoxylase-like metal-dependent hydrolase (beta-lactamase superfamily II)